MSNPVAKMSHRKDAASKQSGRNGAASVEETRRAINRALKRTGYSCKTVSWDDVDRGTVDGSLSGWGPNITDTYLKAKDGTKLFTVRSKNWNEKLGIVLAKDIALLIGNCDRSDKLQNINLQEFLRDPAGRGAEYTGMKPDVRLADTDPNEKVSIRFQTVFLPVAVAADASGRGKMQFAAEAYNYATLSDKDPRNLILLATTQGLSVQADGEGAKRLLLHAGRAPFVYEYWLEAESSAHSVGGDQQERAAEREDALRRGKATSEVIGIEAMGTRFNVLMTIQVPLLQKEPRRGAGGSSSYGAKKPAPKMKPKMKSMAPGMNAPMAMAKPPSMKGTLKPSLSRVPQASCSSTGTASAARVSRGDVHGSYERLTNTAPKRNVKERVTVTCVLYNTVLNGVPTVAHVKAAVDDMEKLFAKCSDCGRLGDPAFDFMKTELTSADMAKIGKKLSTQQPIAPPQPPATVKDVVLAKVAEVEGMHAASATKVLELRLLTLGAIHDDEVKTLLGGKFDVLKSKVEAGDGDGTRAVLLKIKLLVEGALN